MAVRVRPLSLLCSGTIAGARRRSVVELSTNPYQLAAWRATLFYAMEAGQITPSIILNASMPKNLTGFS
jgi:hypothetical protein